jgi:Domain of unknown function (DUF1995)
VLSQVLPDNLTNALSQASEATCLAFERGSRRAVVEVLLPEFWDPVSGPVFAEEGDQQRWWKLTRRFVEDLVQLSGKRARAVGLAFGRARVTLFVSFHHHFMVGRLQKCIPAKEMVECACTRARGAGHGGRAKSRVV